MFRVASLVTGIAAVGLLGWGGHLALRPDPGPEPAFVIAPTEHDLGAVPLGEQVVRFAITNPADRPRRVIGFEDG